jgi:hypothetical protein
LVVAAGVPDAAGAKVADLPEPVILLLLLAGTVEFPPPKLLPDPELVDALLPRDLLLLVSSPPPSSKS